MSLYNGSIGVTCGRGHNFRNLCNCVIRETLLKQIGNGVDGYGTDSDEQVLGYGRFELLHSGYYSTAFVCINLIKKDGLIGVRCWAKKSEGVLIEGPAASPSVPPRASPTARPLEPVLRPTSARQSAPEKPVSGHGCGTEGYLKCRHNRNGYCPHHNRERLSDAHNRKAALSPP